MVGQVEIPLVTEDDIKWVSDIMGLDGLDEPRRTFLKATGTIDVSACPGSGKTTLVVAKLAIMARNWPHKTSGICVLSHTNVAREEIQKRLGNTPVGHRLLGYPHFIDTIHTFVNRFLALPYLQSNGFPPPTVDNDIALAFRWKAIRGAGGDKLRNVLRQRKATIDDVTFGDADFSVLLRGKVFPTGTTTASYKEAQEILVRSAEAGYFKYEEMFVWAEHLLTVYPDISASLSHRFPMVLIDEMQDTSERQAALLLRIFDRNMDLVSVQRVGDPNQEIFKSPNEKNVSDPFPDVVAERTMSVPSSRRFGKTIAALASPFAVLPIENGGLVGIGPFEEPELAIDCKHIIIVFPNDDTTGVLKTYGEHLLASFTDAQLELGDAVALGGVHKLESEVTPGDLQYPKTISHFWPSYDPELSKTIRHPKTLVGYLNEAQISVRKQGDIGNAIGKFAIGFVRLVKFMGEPKKELDRMRKHKAIRELLKQETDLLAQYDGFILNFIVNLAPIDETCWRVVCDDLIKCSAALCVDTANASLALDFLKWSEPDLQTPDADGNDKHGKNECVVANEGRRVAIRLGSIHRAKGQTHLATLLLNTYFHDHSSDKMIDWLCGRKTNGAQEGSRDLTRLKQSYVAMTRPTHLLGVAIRQSALGSGEDEKAGTIAALRKHGWRIFDLTTDS